MAMNVVNGDSLNEQAIRLDYIQGDFVLFGEDGFTVATGNDPRELSNYAFNHGAYSVRHEYSEFSNGDYGEVKP